MADKDLGDGDGPSLELPKLFGRKTGQKGRGEDAPPPSTDEPTPAAEAETPRPAPRPTAPETPAPETPAPEPEQTTAGPTRVDIAPEPAPAEPEQPRRRREPTMPSMPSMPSGVAAVLVGALVAALGIGLTWLGLLGCEAIRGTQSCGGPGLLVMLAIMAAMVIGGAALLKALGVPQSGSLSFLGFGILAVVVLMFLIEHLYEPWVLVTLPVISAAGYGLAHWVTARFTEPDPDFTH